MTRHLGAETLARFRADDVPWWRARGIPAHLAHCASCRELDSELAQVPTLLASTTAPPIPQNLTSRIQGALLHEASLRAGAGQATSAGGETATLAAGTEPAGPRPADGDTGRDDRRPRRSWNHWLPQLSVFGSPVAARALAAAVVIIVVAAGGVAIGLHMSSPSSPSPVSGPAAPAAAPARIAPSTRYGPPLDYSSGGQRYEVRPIVSDAEFTSGQLAGQVSGLAGHSSPAHAPASGTSQAQAPASLPSSPSTSFGNFSVAGLDGCLSRITAGSLLVVLVDVAHFQGSPAAVIVTEQSASGPQQVWVVGTTCSATRSDVLDHTQLSGGS